MLDSEGSKSVRTAMDKDKGEEAQGNDGKSQGLGEDEEESDPKQESEACAEEVCKPMNRVPWWNKTKKAWQCAKQAPLPPKRYTHIWYPGCQENSDCTFEATQFSHKGVCYCSNPEHCLHESENQNGLDVGQSHEVNDNCRFSIRAIKDSLNLDVLRRGEGNMCVCQNNQPGSMEFGGGREKKMGEEDILQERVVKP